MEFDQTKKIEVEVSENVIAENERDIRRERRKAKEHRKVDPLDIALLPVILGVFISLGFLFAGLLGGTSMSAGLAEIGGAAAAVFG